VRDAAPPIGVVVGGAAVREPRFVLRRDIAVCEHVSDVVGQAEALVQRAGIN
jgi:hypothetical protein